MNRKRNKNEQGNHAKLKKAYYFACNQFGLDVEVVCSTYVLEAVFYVVYNKQSTIQDVYDYVAKRAGQSICTAKKHIEAILSNNQNNLKCKYGKMKAMEICETYFDDKYADISSPEIFIFGMAKYIKRHK